MPVKPAFGYELSSVTVALRAHSTVRDAIGAQLKGKTYPFKAALADVEVTGTARLPSPRLSNRDGLAVGIQMRGELWRLILPFAESDELPIDDRAARAVKRLFYRRYQTVWQSEFKLHRRLSTRFARGRIVLAGDAAHLNSPVGGQGMNAGIQDTAVLGPAIIETLKINDAKPLARYAESRRAHTRKGVNRFTNTLTRVIVFRKGKFIRLSLRIANTARRIPSARRRILKRIAMIESEPQRRYPDRRLQIEN